jgi:hypothetical protein
MPTHRSIGPLAHGRLRALPDHLHSALFPSLPTWQVQRYGVHGDGTCFFHSLAAALNFRNYVSLAPAKRQALGKSFRCGFRDEMSRGVWDKLMGQSPQNMKLSFQEVKSSFCKSRRWAEESMIKYVSTHLGFNIVFLDGETGMFYCAMKADNWRRLPTIIMMWVQHSHFEPVLFVKKACKGHVHIRGRLLPGVPEDAAVVNHLMKQFSTMCATQRLPWDD